MIYCIKNYTETSHFKVNRFSRKSLKKKTYKVLGSCTIMGIEQDTVTRNISDFYNRSLVWNWPEEENTKKCVIFDLFWDGEVFKTESFMASQ